MSKTSEPASGRGDKPARRGRQPKKEPKERRKEHETIPVSGAKRQRQGAGMRRLRGGLRRMIPDEATWTRGYRFPSTAATAIQQKALQRMVHEYLKRDSAFRHQDIGADDLAEAFGMSVRGAFTLAAEVRRLEYSPTVGLVIDVLYAMFTKKIAGVLGTRRTKTTEWLFDLVSSYDGTEPGIHQRMWFDDEGQVVDEEQAHHNYDLFRRLHAAFRMDYREWLLRK